MPQTITDLVLHKFAETSCCPTSDGDRRGIRSGLDKRPGELRMERSDLHWDLFQQNGKGQETVTVSKESDRAVWQLTWPP